MNLEYPPAIAPSCFKLFSDGSLLFIAESRAWAWHDVPETPAKQDKRTKPVVPKDVVEVLNHPCADHFIYRCNFAPPILQSMFVLMHLSMSVPDAQAWFG